MLSLLPALAQLVLLINLVSAAPATPIPASSPSDLSSGSSSSNGSLSVVCTPSQCVVGPNSLSAGVRTTTTSNGSAASLTLLPGSYSPSSASLANSSFLNLATASPLVASSGFNASGSAGSAVVSLAAGLTTYSIPLYHGIASYSAVASNKTNSTIPSTPVGSFLLSPNTFAVIHVGPPNVASGRMVVWESVADVGQLQNSNGAVTIAGLQSTTCTIPCASGGTCAANGTCVCQAGFTGATCNACLPGFFGPTCSPCVSGCAICDAGITGTGRCLVPTFTAVTASVCNCINGVCASPSASASCACSAGWSKATNGTQCAVCATGYFATAQGDCLACDPSCATCAGPTGTCITCQPTLGPTSDPTRCAPVASLSSATNGTSSSLSPSSGFITCPAGAYFDVPTSSCLPCSPLCSTCFAGGATSCFACKAPSGLLNGVCVAVDQKSGICNGGATNAAWVLDNVKGVCDAAPAKCTRASIDNFSSLSTRSQLSCSACLAGIFLSNGRCLDVCPAGTVASGTACIPCDSSCSTCSGSPSYCTACSSTSQLSLNGACIAGPSCPAGFFSSPNSLSNSTSSSSTTLSTSLGNSCLACHPDCATCSGKFDTCLTCPPSRPVKSLGSTCVLTCSSSQYFDTASGTCKTCSSGCATCSGGGDGQCLSCSSTTTLKGGNCIAAGCALVVPGFGVCLEQLVTIAPPFLSTPSTTPTKKILPWYFILLIILVGLAFILALIFFLRRKQQARRKLSTAQFANDLDRKAVDMKLRTLPTHIAYPAEPTGYSYEPSSPRFVIGEAVGEDERRRSGMKSIYSQRTAKLETQLTGQSNYTTGSGRQWASNNPFSNGRFSTGA